MASAEQKKAYQVIKQFKGLNTKANRTAIDEDEFSWLENAMPIGASNLKVTPTYSQIGSFTFTSTVVGLFGSSINQKDYLIAFESDGSAEYVDLGSNTKGTLAAAGTFSTGTTTQFQVCDWKNKYLCIVDPVKGYFTWDGTNLVFVGSIGRIGITNPGSGYTVAPIITIGAPSQTGGVQATAICSITQTAGQVTGFTISSGGSGYTGVPVVQIGAAPYPGTQATAVATISSGAIVAVSIVNPGSGYTSVPSVSFTGGGGSGANIAAIIDTGSVTAIAVTNAGSGYTSPPSVTFSGGGGGVNAAATAELLTFATGTLTVTVTSGGSGYTNAANTVVSISGDSPTTPATGTAIISGGQVTQVIMTNHGAGYTNASNVTVGISGGGANVNATATAVVSTDQNTGVASFSGRVWIAAGRNVYYTAPSSVSDFTSLSAGGVSLSDSTLHGNITQIISANNFLYLFGDDSINVISDVRVTTAGTTIFTNTNISASVGSKRPYSIFPYFRSLLFMNDYGVYALVGSTTTKVSDSLDGIFPFIDFTAPITGGQVLINNILCAAFNFKYTGTGGGGASSRYLQAVFFDKKWFLASQKFTSADMTLITSSPVGGKSNLYGYESGKKLYKLFSDTTSNVASYVQTALLPMGDPIRTKQALKFGIEASENAGFPLYVTVDSESTSSNTVTLQAETPVAWYADFAAKSWQNSSAQTAVWETSPGLVATLVAKATAYTDPYIAVVGFGTDDFYYGTFGSLSSVGLKNCTVVGFYEQISGAASVWLNVYCPDGIDPTSTFIDSVTSNSVTLNAADATYYWASAFGTNIATWNWSGNPFGFADSSSYDTTISLTEYANIPVQVLPWISPIPQSSTNTIPWLNNSNAVINWDGKYGLTYFLYKSDAQMWGKYIGLTAQANSAALVYNTFEFEHELRTRF